MHAPHFACLMALAAECNTYAKRNYRVDFEYEGWEFTMAVPTILILNKGKTVGSICPPVSQFFIFDDAWFRDTDVLKALVLFADKFSAYVAEQGIPEFQKFVYKTTFQVRKDLHLPQGVAA